MSCMTYQTWLPYYDLRQMRITLPKQIFSRVQDKPFGHTFWATLEDICCLWHHAACNVYAQRYIGHHSEFNGSFGVGMLARMLRQKVFLSFLFFQISSTYGKLIYDTEYQQDPHNQLLRLGSPTSSRPCNRPQLPPIVSRVLGPTGEVPRHDRLPAELWEVDRATQNAGESRYKP